MAVDGHGLGVEGTFDKFSKSVDESNLMFLGDFFHGLGVEGLIIERWIARFNLPRVTCG